MSPLRQYRHRRRSQNTEAKTLSGVVLQSFFHTIVHSCLQPSCDSHGTTCQVTKILRCTNGQSATKCHTTHYVMSKSARKMSSIIGPLLGDTLKKFLLHRCNTCLLILCFCHLQISLNVHFELIPNVLQLGMQRMALYSFDFIYLLSEKLLLSSLKIILC